MAKDIRIGELVNPLLTLPHVKSLTVEYVYGMPVMQLVLEDNRAIYAAQVIHEVEPGQVIQDKVYICWPPINELNLVNFIIATFVNFCHSMTTEVDNKAYLLGADTIIRNITGIVDPDAIEDEPLPQADGGNNDIYLQNPETGDRIDMAGIQFAEAIRAAAASKTGEQVISSVEPTVIGSVPVDKGSVLVDPSDSE
jgi:hypothetical protein